MCFFSEAVHHTVLKLVPLRSSHLKTSGCTEFGPLNTQKSDILAQNVFFFLGEWVIIQLWNLYHCDHQTWKPQSALSLAPLNTKKSDVLSQNLFFFSEMNHYTALKLVPLWSSDLKTLRVNWVWYSNYKRKGCFCLKCVFSETDHHTALKVVPSWSTQLKTSECTDFGPLNTKKSDALAQNVLFFRSGSSYSFETCTIVIITPENLRVNWVWYSKYKRK